MEWNTLHYNEWEIPVKVHNKKFPIIIKWKKTWVADKDKTLYHLKLMFIHPVIQKYVLAYTSF